MNAHMTNSTVAKTSDPLGRYYTHSAIASLLVDAMSSDAPSLAIDLGAGDGALVREASKVWKTTKFVTVDIDKAAASAGLRAQKGEAFRHHVGDALDRDLAKKLDVKFGQADAALCNPPYIRPRWQKHFGEILEDAGLSSVLQKSGEVPSDLLFVAQNLRFLKSGGRLGLILPDGIIAGEKYVKFRDALAHNHRIERVIELPRRIFKNTDAKAHIVVLSKDVAAGGLISVQRIEENGLLSNPIQLLPDAAKLRMDYSYYASADIARSQVTGHEIRAFTLGISRGLISSSQREGIAVPVFHTTDFHGASGRMPAAFVLTRKQASLVTGVIARTGDILIARVGRNLDSKVCMVRRGFAVVSDCILVLRVLPEFQERVFIFLRSDVGRSALESSTHGVAAKFITTEALLNIKMHP
jgi:type I restriction enzyme M protein